MDEEIDAAMHVADVARDFVALWREQKIAGLPRADRNAAIEDVRHRLCTAVDEWEAAMRRSDQ